MITARYAADESLSGVMAVISSMRTDYARTLSVLQCTAETVGELIDGLIEIEEDFRCPKRKRKKRRRKK